MVNAKQTLSIKREPEDDTAVSGIQTDIHSLISNTTDTSPTISTIIECPGYTFVCLVT